MNPIFQMVADRVITYVLDQVLPGSRSKEEKHEENIDRMIAALDDLGRKLPNPEPESGQSNPVGPGEAASVENVPSHESPGSSGTSAATSQVEAKGKGCLPCSADHLSTVAGALSEALRFARSSSMEHPEVMGRLALCFDELNIMERIDAGPEVLATLSEEERETMRGALASARDLRHMLTDIKTLGDLERAAAEAQRQAREFRSQLFRLSFQRLRPDLRQRVKDRAHELLEQGAEEKEESHAESATGPAGAEGEPGGRAPGGGGLPHQGERSAVPG